MRIFNSAKGGSAENMRKILRNVLAQTSEIALYKTAGPCRILPIFLDRLQRKAMEKFSFCKIRGIQRLFDDFH